MLFSNKSLKKLIVPLIIEQILALTIGLFDTLMVSRAGEAAVSGIALVDGINTLLINIFAALATGGAVVCAQYIGKKSKEEACQSAKQLVLTIIGLSSLIMFICLLLNNQILSLIFGHVDNSVMNNAKIYFYLSALSYPFIGLFNGGAALFRSNGNSKIAMINSFYMNIINVSLNYIAIYILDMGVFGAGLATLTSRAICAVIIMKMLKNNQYDIHIDSYLSIRPKTKYIRSILQIGIPNGLENGMFQMGKLLVQRLVSSFGTTAIAAHAVAFNLTSIAIVPGLAVGLGILTVVGQCVGADDYKQAKYYTKKLMIITYCCMFVTAGLMFIFCRNILGLYNLTQKAVDLATLMVSLHCMFDVLLWPMAFSFPNVLRASNDASFTMIVSTVSMFVCRIGLSYVFANMLGMGVIGVWWAMFVDWFARAVFFSIRYFSGRWMNRKLV